jgi:hypothetical protein
MGKAAHLVAVAGVDGAAHLGDRRGGRRLVEIDEPSGEVAVVVAEAAEVVGIDRRARVHGGGDRPQE